MATVVRLARAGTKKRPYYHVVVTDSRNARDGRFIEQVGSYNPMLPRDNENRIKLTTERLQYWLSVGAQPTDRVAKFLSDAGLITVRTRSDSPKKSAPKAKAQERLKLAAAKAEEAAAAKAEAAAKPAEPEVAPVEEVAPEAVAEAAPEATTEA